MDDIEEVLDLVHQSHNLADRRFQNYDATFRAVANYIVLNDRKTFSAQNFANQVTV